MTARGARRRRLLLVARHYPPAVSGGARRPLLFAQALRAADIDVDVVAPSLPPGEPGLAVPHPNRDPSGASAAPPGVGDSLRNGLRELVLWPDPDIRWCLRAARAALALPRPDWILTTSPPESIHLAGAFLKRRTGAIWAADFRDHWLERPHRVERRAAWRRLVERCIAGHVLRRADVVTAVDAVVAAELAALGARDPQVIPHVPPPAQPPAALPAATINVVHTGSIALSDPSCRIEDLLAPFATAARANPQLRLHFAGRLMAAERAAIAAAPIASACVDHGVVTLAQSRALQAGADALIFVASGKMHVPPSKIVEYLTCEAPIIACGDGPWRRDPRTPAGDPVAALAGLHKGMRAGDPRPRPMTADSAGRLLIDLFDRTRPGGG